MKQIKIEFACHNNTTDEYIGTFIMRFPTMYLDTSSMRYALKNVDMACKDKKAYSILSVIELEELDLITAKEIDLTPDQR